MPWGHPGEHHDFEPQRHDDGYLEVIGFTMTSLVSGPARGPSRALALLCPGPVPTVPRSLALRWKRGQSPYFLSLARTGELTLTSFSGWGLTFRLLSTEGGGVTLTLARASLGKAELEVLPPSGP